MSHSKDDKGDVDEQDNKDGTVTPDKTENDKEDYGKFSFEGLWTTLRQMKKRM